MQSKTKEEEVLCFLIENKNLKVKCRPVIETQEFKVSAIVMGIEANIPFYQEALIRILYNEERVMQLMRWYLEEIWRVDKEMMSGLTHEVKRIIKVFDMGVKEENLRIFVDKLEEGCEQQKIDKGQVILQLERNVYDWIECYIMSKGFQVAYQGGADLGSVQVVDIHESHFNNIVEVNNQGDRLIIVRGIKYFDQWLKFEKDYGNRGYQIEIECFDEVEN